MKPTAQQSGPKMIWGSRGTLGQASLQAHGIASLQPETSPNFSPHSLVLFWLRRELPKPSPASTTHLSLQPVLQMHQVTSRSAGVIQEPQVSYLLQVL